MCADGQSGPESALGYFAADLAIDHLPADTASDSIRERATAVFAVIGFGQGGVGSAKPGGDWSWYVDLWTSSTGPLGVFSKGTIRAGERGALLVLGPEGEDLALMRSGEVLEARDLGFGLKLRIQYVAPESVDG